MWLESRRIISAERLPARFILTIAVGPMERNCSENSVTVRCRSCVRRVCPIKTAKPKVVVADDERVIADTLAMILNQSGFEARAVYSGEKALELAPTLEPDMLISDVIMAALNGIDAAIQIRALLPRIKVLLFSGQAATADLLEKARAQGYEFEILAKPVHPQDLLNKLRSKTAEAAEA